MEKSSFPYIVESLHLQNFRNYFNLDLPLSIGFNILIGANAQGKTNILESIYLISTTKLLRSNKESIAITEGHSTSLVKVQLKDFKTELAIQIKMDERKKAFINQTLLPKPSNILGRLPAICMTTLDMKLVKGDSSERRQFLDLNLSQMNVRYLDHLTRYKRALLQRNALIKACQSALDLLSEEYDLWEEEMANHGVALRKMRAEFMDAIEPVAKSTHKEIGEGEVLNIKYISSDSCWTFEELYHQLKRTRQQDWFKKNTTLGPHRDDMQFTINHRSIKLYGSEGQQRTAMISLKVALLKHMESVLGAPPLLLLDDIFSDLDMNRRRKLVEYAEQSVNQVILTCTDAENLEEDIYKRSQKVKIHQGTAEIL